MNRERDGGSDFRDRGRRVGLAKLLLIAAPFAVVLARLTNCHQSSEEEKIFDFGLPLSGSSCMQVMEYIRSQDKFREGEFAQIGNYAVNFNPDFIDRTVNGWIVIDARNRDEFETLTNEFIDEAYRYLLSSGLKPDSEVRLKFSGGRIENGRLIINEDFAKVTGPKSGCVE